MGRKRRFLEEHKQGLFKTSLVVLSKLKNSCVRELRSCYCLSERIPVHWGFGIVYISFVSLLVSIKSLG
jgi:hypothetical protein